MVRPWLGREIEISREEGSAKLGHEFFHSIALVAETLPAEVASSREGWRVQWVSS
jgi:hypothetical protein